MTVIQNPSAPSTFILTNDRGATVIFRVKTDGTVKITTRTANFRTDQSRVYIETLASPAARGKYRQLIKTGYFAW